MHRRERHAEVRRRHCAERHRGRHWAHTTRRRRHEEERRGHASRQVSERRCHRQKQLLRRERLELVRMIRQWGGAVDGRQIAPRQRLSVGMHAGSMCRAPPGAPRLRGGTKRVNRAGTELIRACVGHGGGQ